MTSLTIELDQHRDTVAQKRTEIRRLLANVEVDERVLRHRKEELETQLVATWALSSTEKTCYSAPLIAIQAAQDLRHQKQNADVFDDLWRSSCEMPDAPHLREG
jgi:hypothetical protein